MKALPRKSSAATLFGTYVVIEIVFVGLLSAARRCCAITWLDL
ncbi:MAG: hypothetical protein WD009_08675 [Phycisphaeraceae bacterium]